MNLASAAAVCLEFFIGDLDVHGIVSAGRRTRNRDGLPDPGSQSVSSGVRLACFFPGAGGMIKMPLGSAASTTHEMDTESSLVRALIFDVKGKCRRFHPAGT